MCTYSSRRIRKNKLRKQKRAVSLLILFFITMLSYQMFKPSVIEACTPIKYVAVIVKQGDSLWSIADKYDNNSTTDIRRYIDTIQQYNQIDNTDILQPGDIINVPIY